MKKILLVHEAELFLRMEQTLLRRRDHQIYTAQSGAEALSVAEEKDPHMVILDEGLSDRDSLEVCRTLRTDPRSSDISILIALDRRDPARIQQFREAGADDFFVKPVSRLVLNQKVGALLNLTARRFLRTLVKLEVEAHQDSKSLFFGNSVNISEGGILLEAPHELPVGESLKLRFFLPEDPDAIEVTADVIRPASEMSTNGPSYGLSFREISEEDRGRIREYVDSVS